jgi:hypothetical protein
VIIDVDLAGAAGAAREQFEKRMCQRLKPCHYIVFVMVFLSSQICLMYYYETINEYSSSIPTFNLRTSTINQRNDKQQEGKEVGTSHHDPHHRDRRRRTEPFEQPTKHHRSKKRKNNIKIHHRFYQRFEKLKKELTTYRGGSRARSILNLCETEDRAGGMQLLTPLPTLPSVKNGIRFIQMNTFLGFRESVRLQWFGNWIQSQNVDVLCLQELVSILYQLGKHFSFQFFSSVVFVTG